MICLICLPIGGKRFSDFGIIRSEYIKISPKSVPTTKYPFNDISRHE